MATAYIRFGGAMGGGAPVLSPIPDATATLTTSGTSQATTITSKGTYARISAVGGAIRYAVGPAPTALAGSGDWVLDGMTVDIGPLNIGDKIAVIDAA
jgi:hypothetical protein